MRITPRGYKRYFSINNLNRKENSKEMVGYLVQNCGMANKIQFVHIK